MAEHLSGILSGYRGTRGELIPILQKVQERFGYLAEDVMDEVAAFTGVAKSNVFGVASFYNQFRFDPPGKNQITVCRGTACHVQNAPAIIDELRRQLGIEVGGTTPDREYSLETVACIGCCALAPCLKVNEDVHGRLTPEKARKLFSHPVTEKGGQDVQ
jgi:NADH-quinone oxidoreductase subunit E